MSEENMKQPEEVVLPPAGSLLLSTSPHVHQGESITTIMLKVLICLMPVVTASICIFGLNAVLVLVYCSAFCLIFEYLWNLLLKQPQTVKDLSAVLTGVILALNLPASAPWWLCLTGSFIAIIIAKQIFGGLGQNPFNPAAVARVALLIGFAGPMTTWIEPMQGFTATEIMTHPTPLGTAQMAAGTEGALKTFEGLESTNGLMQAFLGDIGGSLGETSALAILLGGIGLIVFRLIKWQIPFAIIGTTMLFTWLVHTVDPTLTPGPLFHVCSGGLMLGAFFMATDMVTSPITHRGAFIFGVMIGLITCVIRIWGAYPDGVSFAIVIMNALVPLIDRLCYKRPFGWSPVSASALQMRRNEVK